MLSKREQLREYQEAAQRERLEILKSLSPTEAMLLSPRVVGRVVAAPRSLFDQIRRERHPGKSLICIRKDSL